MNIDRDEILRLTEEYGGAWGINHTRRLLRLIPIIGEAQVYNADVLWVAARLHDWGAYGKWAQPGVDHALRSRQVAEAFLAERDYPSDEAKLILDCIEFHHADNSARCLEVQLLSDADALDFLGVVGVLGNNISVADATLKINREDALIIDVRETHEWDRGHIPNARHIALGQIGKRMHEIEKFKSRPVIVVCASGNRSSSACGALKRAGFEQVFNLSGGMGAWSSAGLPTTTKG